MNQVRNDGEILVATADMAIASAVEGRLVAHGLGSGVAVTAYDPVQKLGGMLHYKLPELVSVDPSQTPNPSAYAATAVPMLVEQLLERGASVQRLVLCAAGGAELDDGAPDPVGRRNLTALRRVLWRLDLGLTAQDTGGAAARSMQLDLDGGAVRVWADGCESVLWQPGETPGPGQGEQ